MVGFYAKNRIFFVYQLIILLVTIFLCSYAFGFPQIPSANIILLGCTLLIGVSGLLYGTLASLGLSLLVLFLFGTTLLWRTYFSNVQPFQLWEIVVWMVAFPAMALISGMFYKWMTSVLAENREMKEKFSALVTIDEVTGFNNDHRFHFHVEEEFKRTLRTGSPFSLLLIKIKYFDRFKQVYGVKETNHLLRTISTILLGNLRITDAKFRIADDTFAIILVNTVEENTGNVIKKIESLLKHHRLADQQRDVTLTLAFGISHYHEELFDFTEMIQHAQHDLEQYVQ